MHMRKKRRRKRTWSEILEEAKQKREKMVRENNASSMEGSYADDSSDSDDEDDDDTVEVPITLPEALHAKLEDDCYFVTSKRQLVQLPSDHTALGLMEAYIRHFAYRCQAHNVRVHVRQQGTTRMPGSLTTANASSGHSVVAPPLPQYNVDLCREVMDGVRILFDLLLPTNLLYDCERAQFKSLFTSHPRQSNGVTEDSSPTKLTAKAGQRSSVSPTKETPPILEPQTPGPNDPPPVLKPEAVVESKEEQEQVSARRITRRFSTSNAHQVIPAHGHQVIPAPVTRELRSSDSTKRRSLETKPSLSAHKKDDQDGRFSCHHHLSTRNVRYSARLASQSSSSSSPPVITNMEGIPTLEVLTSSSSPPLSCVVSQASLNNGDTNQGAGLRDKLLTVDVGKIPQTGEFSIRLDERGTEEGMDHLERNCWRLLQDNAHYNGTQPPCAVYGAQHLLRLFVKLPEMLGRMELPPKKLKPLVKHIEMFLRWLSATDQLLEYFPDKAYVHAAEVNTDVPKGNVRRGLTAN